MTWSSQRAHWRSEVYTLGETPERQPCPACGQDVSREYGRLKRHRNYHGRRWAWCTGQ